VCIHRSLVCKEEETEDVISSISSVVFRVKRGEEDERRLKIIA